MTLSREEIEKMEAGKEMDRLIAKHIFSQNVEPVWNEAYKPGDLLKPGMICYVDSHWSYPYTEDYSTDISAAWEVAEKFRGFSVGTLLHGGWAATFINPNPMKDAHVTAKADTAPLAICRAALILAAQGESK